MEEQEKSLPPEKDNTGLIAFLSILAAFVASITFALVIGIVFYINNPVASVETEPQRATTPTQNQGAQRAQTSGGVKAQSPSSSSESGNAKEPASGANADQDSEAQKETKPASNSSDDAQPAGNEGSFSNGQVLITTASDNNDDPVYHSKYCSAAAKIAEADKRWYPSAEAAENDGRRLCGYCAKG